MYLGVDGEGNVHVAGWTDNLGDFPMTTDASPFAPVNPGSQVGFLAKLNPKLEVLEHAVRTGVAQGMDVLDDGRVVLIAHSNPGLATTPNAINEESGTALIVYKTEGVTPEYAGEGMFVETLKAIELH